MPTQIDRHLPRKGRVEEDLPAHVLQVRVKHLFEIWVRACSSMRTHMGMSWHEDARYTAAYSSMWQHADVP
jgi:hypothetical protein